MDFLPLATVGSLRACGAQIFFSPCLDVYSSMLLVAVAGSIDSHGGNALTTSFSVYANMLPVVRLGDISASCPWVKPQHFCQPVVLADYTVYSG